MTKFNASQNVPIGLCLHPGNTLPSRTHFPKLMERKYKKKFQGLKSAIKPTKHVRTSVATEAYLGITCHYIGDKWNVKSICFTTMALENRNTASNIAVWSEDVAARFEIPPSKIIAIVHGNGAHIVAAAKKNWRTSMVCHLSAALVTPCNR